MNQHCGTGLRCGCAILQSCAEGKLLDNLDLSTNCALVAVCNAQTDANGTKLVVDRSMHAFETHGIGIGSDFWSFKQCLGCRSLRPLGF